MIISGEYEPVAKRVLKNKKPLEIGFLKKLSTTPNKS